MISSTSWQQIYTSLKLMMFLSSSMESRLIKKVGVEYAKFLEQFFPSDNSIKLDIMGNLIPFTHSLLVRTVETLEKSMSSSDRNELFKVIASKLEIDVAINPGSDPSGEIQNSLMKRYRIIIMVWNNYLGINELQFLLKKIRNSASHFEYETHNNNILIKDYHKDKQNFRVNLKDFDFLRLVMEFVILTNDFLIERKLIDHNS